MLLVKGTALEIQDKLAGNLPVEENEYVAKEVWVAESPSDEPHKELKKVPVVVLKKVTSVANVYSVVRLSDEVFLAAVEATVEEWKDDESSSSVSSDED